MIAEFTIDPAYITSVTVRTDHPFVTRLEEATDEDLIQALKYSDSTYSIQILDHPEFTALRDQLEREGYIQTERQWWNGDRVLKRFRLNGVLFEPGEQFACAAAMRFHLESESKRQSKKGGNDA